MEMSRVLVLFAHPVLERSRVNRRLLDAIRDLDGSRSTTSTRSTRRSTST